MHLQEYETKVELCGKDYAALISFEWNETYPLIDSVEISHSVKVAYNGKGEYAPHVEKTIINITKMLDGSQIAVLSDEICADALYRQQEAKAEAWIMRQENRFFEAA